jgi:AraC family transcriptional regulator
MLQRTETYYRQKVIEVLNYVHDHLSDNLSVRFLSEQFGFSFFHFHRILKSGLNEPLGAYINRIRLGTAIHLMQYTDLPLSEIALQIGYNDCSAFSKAFSKEFGFCPKKFKSNNTIVLNTHIDCKINGFGKLVTDIRPKIVILDDKLVIHVKYQGDYSGKKFITVWDDFWEIVTMNKMLRWNPFVFSVYYNDPFETTAVDCRAECCVSSFKKPANNNLEMKSISGGKFVMYRFQGPHQRLLEMNEYVLKDWIIHANIKVRNSPVIERYLNHYRYTEPNRLLTEVYIPIE